MSSMAKNDPAPKIPKSKAKGGGGGTISDAPAKASCRVRLRTPKGRSLPAGERLRMVDFLLNDHLGDRMKVYKALQDGLPLVSVLRMIDASDAFKRGGVLSKIVGKSDRTLARRLKEPEVALSAEQSTRALLCAEIMDKAIKVLGSSELAEQWMSQPARGLSGETPINLITNGVGYELVDDLLTRMDYGVYW